MHAKTNVTLENLTPELAKEFATMTPMPGERKLKQSHVEYLHGHLLIGTFISPCWRVAVQRSTGKKFRLDGQHSSEMLANVPQADFPKGLLVTVETFEFDSVDDDGLSLFNLFDNPKSTRTNTDVMSWFRDRHADLASLSEESLVSTCAAIDYYRTEVSAAPSKSTAPRERGRFFNVEEYRRYAVWRGQWTGSAYARFLLKPGIGAEMLRDWKFDPTMATAFWCEVFTAKALDGNNIGPDDESWELANQLKDWTVKTGVSQDTFYKRARKSFDRWKRLKVADSKKAAAEATPVTHPVIDFIPPQASEGQPAQA